MLPESGPSCSLIRMKAPRALLTPPVGPRDHVLGAADARVTLVEYGDFECPFCGAAYPQLKRVLKALAPKVRFVFRHFPLGEQHPHAPLAAEVAAAAARPGLRRRITCSRLTAW